MPSSRGPAPLLFVSVGAALAGFAAGLLSSSALSGSPVIDTVAAETRRAEASGGRSTPGVPRLDAPVDRSSESDAAPAAPTRRPTANEIQRARSAADTMGALPKGKLVLDGTVRDEEGQPIGDVELRLLPAVVGEFEMALPGDELRPGADDFDARLERAAREWGLESGQSRTTTSSADGRFRFEDLPAHAFRIQGQREGWTFRSRGRRQFMPDPPGATDAESIELIGTRVGYAVVDVLGPGGGSYSGEAILRVTQDGGPNRWVRWSPEDRRVALTRRTVRLRAYAEPIPGRAASRRNAPMTRLFSTEKSAFVRPNTPETVTLELQPRCMLFGEIRGAEIGSSQVFTKRLQDGEEFGPTSSLTRAKRRGASNGVFAFEDLIPGRYAVGLVGEDSVPLDIVVVEVVPGMTDVVIQRTELKRGQCVRITALAPGGSPLDDVGYSFVWKTGDADRRTEGMGTMPGEDGVTMIDLDNFVGFDFAEWPEGTRMWIRGSHRHFGRAEATLTPEAADVTLQFVETSWVDVRIAGDLTGAEFVVTLSRSSDGQGDAFRTASLNDDRDRISPDGHVRFEGVPSGALVVKLERSLGWWGSRLTVETREVTAGPEGAQVQLTAPPLHDVTVTLAPPEAERGIRLWYIGEDGKERSLQSAETDDRGEAVFRDLPPGDYELRDPKNGARLRFSTPASALTWDQSGHVLKLKVAISDAEGLLKAWGFQGGDLITALDGAPLEGSREFRDAVAASGGSVTVERGGEEITVRIPALEDAKWDRQAMGGTVRLRD